MGSNIVNLPNNGLQMGTRAAGVTIFYSEITQMISDSRWILIAVVLFCVFDFRLGCKESEKRKEAADKAGNTLLSEFYRFSSLSCHQAIIKQVRGLCVVDDGGRVLRCGVPPLHWYTVYLWGLGWWSDSLYLRDKQCGRALPIHSWRKGGEEEC